MIHDKKYTIYITFFKIYDKIRITNVNLQMLIDQSLFQFEHN